MPPLRLISARIEWGCQAPASIDSTVFIMFERMFDGVQKKLRSGSKTSSDVEPDYSSNASTPEPLLNTPIAVNWDDDRAAIQTMVSESIQRNLTQEYLLKNQFDHSEPAPVADASDDVSDEHDMKERIMNLLEKLKEGMQWTVVEYKGSEWYMRIDVAEDQPVLENAMLGWLEHVAADCTTPAHVLDELVQSEDPEVRIALADNPNTPIDMLLLLTHDESADVRYSLAENHNVPLEVLRELLEDDNPYVADRARRTISRICQSAAITADFSCNTQPALKAVAR